MKHESHTVAQLGKGVYKWTCHRCGHNQTGHEETRLKEMAANHDCPDQDPR